MSDATEAEVEAVARAWALLAAGCSFAPSRSEADIKADAWDEGHAAGFCEGSHGFNPDECAPHENPYRQEQSND